MPEKRHRTELSGPWRKHLCPGHTEPVFIEPIPAPVVRWGVIKQTADGIVGVVTHRSHHEAVTLKETVVKGKRLRAVWAEVPSREVLWAQAARVAPRLRSRRWAAVLFWASMHPTKSLVYSLLALIAVFAAGCAERACEAEAPSIEVSLTLGSDIASGQIAQVVAEVIAAGQQKTAALAPDPLKTKGRASFVVIVGPEGEGGFDYTISVRLLDSAGAELGAGRVEAAGVGNGCNMASLRLSGAASPTDGGVDVSRDGAVDATVDGAVDLSVDGSVDVVPQPPVSYVLTSQTNLNLQTYLSTRGAPTDTDFILRLPSGATIGSSNVASPAITSGDLSAYKKVTLEVSGEVQGAGGAANGGAGGDAIVVTSVMGIAVKPGGAVRGGGGGGGKGGAGGSCDDPAWTVVPFSAAVPKSYWKNFESYDPPRGSTLVLESGQAMWDVRPMDPNLLFSLQGGTYWKRGTQKLEIPAGAYVDVYFECFRTTAINSGSGGTGGNGGRGQGYAQSAAAGSAGADGAASRCGKGGTGGAGGGWAAAGEPGAAGATGYKHTNYNLSTPQQGSAGSGGGAAGKALSCSGAGVYYSNSGTVDGSVDCLRL